MDIVVVGAGSLGSLIGGLLTRDHAITLVGRSNHVDVINESGLRVSGEHAFTVHPEASTDVTIVREADLVIVTVKSYDTEAIARDLREHSPSTVLSLQNGMGNEALLADLIGGETEILAGTTTYGAIYREPGHVECTGRGIIELGSLVGEPSPRATHVGTTLTSATVSCTVAADMPYRLWKKLAINAGINAVTALAGVENGLIISDPLRSVATDAARETAQVARSYEIPLSDKTATKALFEVARDTRRNISSMAADVMAGRRTEVDAINGHVVDSAPSNIDVPVNDVLHRLVVAWEHSHGLR